MYFIFIIVIEYILIRGFLSFEIQFYLKKKIPTAPFSNPKRMRKGKHADYGRGPDAISGWDFNSSWPIDTSTVKAQWKHRRDRYFRTSQYSCVLK